MKMTESFKSVMLLDTHIKQKERYKMERDMERDITKVKRDGVCDTV